MKAHLKWMLIFGALCAVCAGVLVLMGRSAARTATVSVDGETVRTVDLSVDSEFDVETGDGFNHISVKDGKIAVTAADCPDRLCVRRGYVGGGVPIVCLPHRLSVSFGEGDGVDAVTGR